MDIPYIFLNKNYGKIRVALPPIEFFIEKLENKKHFHFVKVNHGFFDIASNSKPRTPKELIEKMYPLRGRFHEYVDEKKYGEAVRILWQDLRWRGNKDVYVGISDSNGLGWLRQRNKQGYARTYRSIAQIINMNDPRPYLHGGLIRHYTVTEEINQLIKIFKNKKEYNVILIGPAYCHHYEKHIGKFKHIRIPPSNAINVLPNIMDKVNNCLKGKKHNIVLGSCALMSLSVARALRENGRCKATYIDIGRAFDFYLNDQLKQPWLDKEVKDKWIDVVQKMRKNNNLIKKELL